MSRYESRVDTLAVVDGITLRLNGDEGIFIKPCALDGDGEFHMNVSDLGDCLRVLGINRADVYPNG